VLTVGDVTVELLHTPGHSPGHLSLAIRSSPGDVLEAVLAGDLVAAESSVWVGVPEGDVSAYLESIERLARLAAPVLGAGPGPPGREAAGGLADVSDPRGERAGQGSAARAAGPAGAAAVTAAIYPKLTGSVADLARRSVLAHLAKAESDGLVIRSGQGDGAT